MDTRPTKYGSGCTGNRFEQSRRRRWSRANLVGDRNLNELQVDHSVCILLPIHGARCTQPAHVRARVRKHVYPRPNCGQSRAQTCAPSGSDPRTGRCLFSLVRQWRCVPTPRDLSKLPRILVYLVDRIVGTWCSSTDTFTWAPNGFPWKLDRRFSVSINFNKTWYMNHACWWKFMQRKQILFDQL